MWGNLLKLSIFGESHGAGLGITISGFVPGFPFPEEEIQQALSQRAPGQKNTTPRKEADLFEVLSGIHEGKTTGAPITVLFRNSNTQSKDYENLRKVPRPSHADYPAQIKYKGFQDVRGGGHFSGRLTAPLVFAGSLAKAYLKTKGISIESTLVERKEIEAQIEHLISEGDSIGASISCTATGLPVGLGSPFFDSLESHIAHLAFSVPGVKGIEFGLGFAFIGKRGSEVNDGYRIQNDEIYTEQNNNGGILGGLSTGMPLQFRVVFKPTASIFKEQHSVNLFTRENTDLQIIGRHDPCIALRASIIIESIAALAILDQLWMGAYYG